MGKRGRAEAKAPTAKAPGGHRQHIQWDASSSSATPSSSSAPSSHLARLLLQEWCWSGMSPIKMQQIAAAAMQDGAKGNDLQSLATLGSSGQQPKNCHRDLVQRLKPPALGPAVYEIRLWYKFRFNVLKPFLVKCLLPHRLFAYLFSKHSKVFHQKFLGGGPATIEDFWTAMRQHPAMRNHPMLSRGDYKSKCVPLGLHGDSVPVAGIGRKWVKSCLALSWQSLLACGSTVEFNYLIIALYKVLCVKEGPKATMAKVWKTIRWSFYWLWKGVWPTHDEEGVPITSGPKGPLAGGYYGVLWAVKGDL
eukprot:14854881-Alexandrium_andersonii.AAC.1